MFKYRDEATARRILAAIGDFGLESKFMHVCGTHQDTIVRFGLEEMLADAGITIQQGPGCPVCVTTSREIADVITLAENGVTVTAFGDMMRVPTSIGSLFDAKSRGADVRIVYSVEDAVRMASEQTGPLVFVAVGFETTAPSTAVPLRKELPSNFSIYSCHRVCPPVLEAVFNMGETRVNGLIMPGHVAVITGYECFRPFSERYGLPQVVAGFEPLDILMACYMLTRQRAEGRHEVENEYTRLVRPAGNPVARALMDEAFKPADRAWRGFPTIPESALALRDEHAAHDAFKVHADILATTPDVEDEAEGCMCGEVLRGVMRSEECPLFGTACRPADPKGPCMVSDEGSCNIAYKFRKV